MCFYMLSQMVTAHKPFITNRTGEPLLAGVRTQMALQFVRSRKSLAAKQPIAYEWSFTGMPAQMCLQVTGFAVDLAASGDVTTVDVLLAQMYASRSKTLGFLAVGTVAGGTS